MGPFGEWPKNDGLHGQMTKPESLLMQIEVVQFRNIKAVRDAVTAATPFTVEICKYPK